MKISRLGASLLWLLFLVSTAGLRGQIEIAQSAGVDNIAAADLGAIDYQPAVLETPIFDNGKFVYLRLDLAQAPEEDQRLVISYPLLDTISLYAEDSAGVLRMLQQTGQAFPFDSRQTHATDFSFLLDPDIQRYYLKIYSTKPIVVPLDIEDPSVYYERVSNTDFYFGLYGGLILVMILYNLSIFLVTRDVSYVYYVGYLLTLGLAQAALFGYTDRFLFADSPWINKNFPAFSGAMVGIASIFFIQNFLHLREKAPIFHRLLFSVVIADLLGVALMGLGYSAIAYNLINFTALIGSLMAIVVAIVLVRRGYKPAYFFLAAWTIFLLGVIIFALKDLAILPYTPLMRSSMLFGSAIEVVLLSIALADRINQLRMEKEASQEEALSMAKENERITKEQNINLEKRVAERTMELQEINEELRVTLENLKETQAQLVDAEKMASLGQLTAGIAHEINNPINFISSNIGPLQRDLADLYSLIEKFAGLQSLQENEEFKTALAHMEELDYEFLKQELVELVEGINDGAKRTAEIVLGLRNFSRLDEDDVKTASLAEGLNSTLVLLRNKTKDLIKVECEYDDGVPEVECYPGKLNQAFMNILNNGVYAVNKKEYAAGEEPTLKVMVKKAGEEHVSVHLIDNGVGMDESTRKKIFDPFFTTKEVGEGTGLGMSIVFRIVEKHNGKLDIHSQLGKGSEFVITLPIRQPNTH